MLNILRKLGAELFGTNEDLIPFQDESEGEGYTEGDESDVDDTSRLWNPADHDGREPLAGRLEVPVGERQLRWYQTRRTASSHEDRARQRRLFADHALLGHVPDDVAKEDRLCRRALHGRAGH